MINERLKKVRKERGVSQKDVANYLGISISAYSNYEQGIRKPDLETLVKICDYFDITSDYLLGRVDII